MGKYRYVISKKIVGGGFTDVAPMLGWSVERRRIVALGESDLIRREGGEGSAVVGMEQCIW